MPYFFPQNRRHWITQRLGESNNAANACCNFEWFALNVGNDPLQKKTCAETDYQHWSTKLVQSYMVCSFWQVYDAALVTRAPTNPLEQKIAASRAVHLWPPWRLAVTHRTECTASIFFWQRIREVWGCLWCHFQILDFSMIWICKW